MHTKCLKYPRKMIGCYGSSSNWIQELIKRVKGVKTSSSYIHHILHSLINIPYMILGLLCFDIIS